MKVLSFGVLYFKLPDDFSGGLGEALRALADYHEKRAGSPEQTIEPPKDLDPNLTMVAHIEDFWDNFWTGVEKGRFRVYGNVGISEYPEDGSPSAGLDLNTGEPE